MFYGIFTFGLLAIVSASNESELKTFRVSSNITKWVHKSSEELSGQSTPSTIHVTNHRHDNQESTATEVTEKINKALHHIHSQKKLLNKSNQYSKLYKEKNKPRSTIKPKQNKTQQRTKKQKKRFQQKRNGKQTRKNNKKINKGKKLNHAKLTKKSQVKEHFTELNFVPTQKGKKRVVRQPDDGLYIVKNLDDITFLSSEDERNYDTVNVNVKNYWKK